MSRLTKRNAMLKASCKKNGTYNCLLEDDCEICDYNNKILEKLAHYEDLEEQGRLIELPCKLYEEVWVAHEQIATFRKRFERESTIVDWMEQGYVIGHTKAEAEAKLAELKGGEQDA